MNSTLTQEQQTAITDFLKDRHISSGLGTELEACSIAAINLALSGELTDNTPDCMSEVIGHWMIFVQDSMPNDMRNSNRWRLLLPLAAGTGREHERERLEIILQWMWEVVLPSVQPIAENGGFGQEWQRMCNERTQAASRSASWAASRAADAAASKAADAASRAAEVVSRAAEVAAEVAEVAAEVASRTMKYAVWAAADAAVAAAAAADAAAWTATWESFDPCGLLERLIAVGE